MAATIRDIAAAAGVAVGTASRALNNSGSIAPATKTKVLEAAATLNYVPNAQARSLRSERTNTAGLLIPDARNPFFATLSYWVERAMHEAGVSVLTCSAHEDPALMTDYLHVLRTQRVDGIIVAPFYSAEAALKPLATSPQALVFVDRTIPSLDIPSVTSDTAHAMHQAVQHLHRSGHTRIGYISGPHDTSTGRERLEQFTHAARQLGITVDIEPGDFQEETGHIGMNHLLTRGTHAVIAADSLMTQGAIHACLDAGINPSTDIDLIGFDETPATALLRPALPLIVQDIEQLARESARLLLSQRGQIRGNHPSRNPATPRGPSLTIPATFHLPEKRTDTTQRTRHR